MGIGFRKIIRHLAQIRVRCANMIQAAPFIPPSVRRVIMKMRGASISPSATIANGSYLDSNISVGAGTRINVGCLIDGSALVCIDSNVNIGMRVTIFTSTHRLGNSDRRCGTPLNLPVCIRDGAWIGATATILPGVTVGTGAIVAAGAVVTTDVESNSIYAGVPAKKIRNL
jgi:maltose O-acetyltransferase